MRVHVLLIMASLLLFTACSSNEDKGPKYNNEKEFYEAAQKELKARQWETAIKNLQGLEENYPFGTYAEQAQLELIYAYYRNFEHEAATAAAERFIRLHPQHREVDYAYYMKGLASFTEGTGMFERFLPTDLTQRDPGAARESFAHFAQLLSRFPNSSYAPDARKRMIYLCNLLGRYEIHVANYYLKRGSYLAAVNRGRYVVENFQQTPAVPDALAVMVQGYHLLGLEDLAATPLQTLKLNYPEHPALSSSGEFDYDYSSESANSSWLSYATLGLLNKQEPHGFDSRSVYDPEWVNKEGRDEARRKAEEKSAAATAKPWYSWLTFGLIK